MSLNQFQSKILLFGEYSILNGSKALAVPYGDFSGFWTFEKYPVEERNFSRENLSLFLQKNWTSVIDQEKFVKEFQEGLWFRSSIPQGFGLGSSGALVAGILSRYGKKDLELSRLKEVLSTLEGHFHGSSSGLDPLVSYLASPIQINDFQNIEILKNPYNLKNFFLVDTHTPRKTGPLVEIYKEKLKDSLFQKTCVTELTHSVNNCIESFLNLNSEGVAFEFEKISKIQWEHFQEMIPLEMRELWTIGIKKRDYFLKLCGAGGGGYLLGYSLHPTITQEVMNSNNISIRWL